MLSYAGASTGISEQLTWKDICDLQENNKNDKQLQKALYVSGFDEVLASKRTISLDSSSPRDIAMQLSSGE